VVGVGFSGPSRAKNGRLALATSLDGLLLDLGEEICYMETVLFERAITPAVRGGWHPERPNGSTPNGTPNEVGGTPNRTAPRTEQMRISKRTVGWRRYTAAITARAAWPKPWEEMT
jgi:hypothetical protein